LLPLVACGPTSDPVRRIVIVTFDTTRADRLGCYGYEDAATPNIDAFAADGVLFEQAVSAIPTTLPSHSTMFTGLYPFDHGVRYNIVFRLGAEAFTLAEALRSAGYGTAAFPASFILASRFGLNQGFDTWSEPPKSDLRYAGSPGTVQRPAGEGVDLALEWLERQRGRKSFLWLHFYDPHAPYTPPFPFLSRFRGRPYDGEIAYADAQFGRLLEHLRADDDWRSTLVVVAGDHGEGLHEHRERFHASLVYETTQRVPLIIGAPAARPGRVAEPVGLADLMPTVLDLAGIDPPPGLRGTSLRPALEGGRLPRRDLYFESLAGALNYGWAELEGVRRGSWKLIDSPDPELFDLETDPSERINLALLEPERVTDLRNALRELSEPIGSGSHAEAALEQVLDPETEALLASLGYTGGGADGTSVENAAHPRDLIDMEGELMTAQAAFARRDWEEVERLSAYIMQRDPSNRWALHNAASALIELQRPREAQDLAAEQLKYYPDAQRSFSMLARTYEAQGDYDKAWEVLQSGLRKNPDSELLTYFALVTAFDAEHEQVCTDEVPGALAQHPGSSKMMVLQARCLAREDEVDSALEWLLKAVRSGFRQVELLERAEDFEEVVRLPGFAELRRSVAEEEAGTP
jgi:arylsulfatase A-like enzyme